MSHILILTEGYCDDIERWKKDFSGRMYAKGHAKLRMREVRIFTCAINEVGEAEFLGDMNSLQGRIWADDEKAFGWNKMLKYVKWLLKPLGIKDIDFSKYPSTNIKGSAADGKLSYNVHFIPIGRVDDRRTADGKLEMV